VIPFMIECCTCCWRCWRHRWILKYTNRSKKHTL